MKPAVRCAAIAIAVIVASLAAATIAGAETWTLELKRIGTANGPSGQTPDYIVRAQAANAQSFYGQVGGQGKDKVELQLPGVREQAAAFEQLVKKEPKYESDHPFRGVAKLGSQQYAFALDIVPPKPKAKEAKAETKAAETPAKPDSPIAKLAESLLKAIAPESPPSPKPAVYNRLYFDFNRNGDLTDDKVVEATSREREFGYGYAVFGFPQIDVAIDAGGVKLDYSFLMNGYLNASGEVGYAVVTLNAAAYREGNVTLNGKKRHVVLIDANSNGRFDDETKFSADRESPGGQLNAEPGDVLLVDPDRRNPSRDSPYDADSGDGQLPVSKVVRLDGRFYDLAVSPAGDRVALAPSSVRLGNVTNPNDGFRAVIYSDKGLLRIKGDKGTPTPVPEGRWKLLSYTIDQTGRYKPSPPPEKKKQPPKKGRSAVEALAEALEAILSGDGPRSGPRNTLVSAQATAGCKPIEVRAGETVAMPFGPPYTPTVTASPLGPDKKQLRLTLSLVGSAGEECTNLVVEGGRPKPEFTIADPQGKVVQSGNFEYG
jgi:hypothetical protein